MNIFESVKLNRKKYILKKLVPNGLSYGSALKLLQEMNYDLCLINIELAKEADNIPYDIIHRLPFSFDKLTTEEREILEEYCEYVVFSSY